MSSKKLIHFAGSFIADLKFRVLKANYITLTWKPFIESLDPIFQNLLENCCGSDFVPIMTDEFPAPEFSL